MAQVKLLSLSGGNFLGASDQAACLDFEGRNAALCGPNNSGKSVLYTAIRDFAALTKDDLIGRSGVDLQRQWIGDGIVKADLFHFDRAPAFLEARLAVAKELISDFDALISLGIKAQNPAEIAIRIELRNNAKILASLHVQGVDTFRAAQTKGLVAQTWPLPGGGTTYRVRESLVQNIANIGKVLAPRMVCFPASRRLEHGGTIELNSLATGLGIVGWVKGAVSPNPENASARENNRLLRDFEAEFARFAGFRDLSLRVPDNNPSITVTIDGHLKPLTRLGHGIGECLLILLIAKLSQTLNPPIDIIVIDEPELHLNPTLQRHLIAQLEQSAPQLIVMTHSATVVNEIQTRGGKIFRTEFRSEDKCISVVEVNTKQDLLKTFTDIGISPGDILQAHKVVWVEGPNDVPVFKAWVYKNPTRGSQTVAVVPLSGRSFLARNFDPSELVKLNPRSLVIIDSEKQSAEAQVDPRRMEFQETCRSLGLQCHITERRSTENYLGRVALQLVYGESVPVNIDHFRLLTDQGIHQFTKAKNGEVAREMGWAELQDTDIGSVLDSFLNSS